MSKPAFTPGPWHMDRLGDIYGPNGDQVGSAWNDFTLNEPRPIDLINGQLQAAAPELLEALGQALEWIHEYESYISDSDRTAWLDKADKLVKILEG
jgi:hypothetical protein